MTHQSLNRAELIGRVGDVPIIRRTHNGEAVVNLAIATSDKWRDKATGEPREATEWHRVTAFARLAEIIGDLVRKGSLVHIEGKMSKRMFIDRDGASRESFEIRAHEIRVLSHPSEGGFGDHD